MSWADHLASCPLSHSTSRPVAEVCPLATQRKRDYDREHSRQRRRDYNTSYRATVRGFLAAMRNNARRRGNR